MNHITTYPVARRGCGTRKAGGIYAVCKLGAGGTPLRDFIIDSPSVALANLAVAKGLTARGVKLIDLERDGVTTWHVADQVGRENYPNVADFVEEVAVLGMSRRLPRTLDFTKLTAGSRMLLLHARAHIDTFADYYASIGRACGGTHFDWNCPRQHQPHTWADPAQPPDAMCAGLWWADLEDGEADLGDRAQRHGLRGSPGEIELTPWRHALPASVATGWQRPAEVAPQYRLAAFMWLPISGLEIVRGRHGEEKDALDATAKCPLPREVIDA